MSGKDEELFDYRDKVELEDDEPEGLPEVPDKTAKDTLKDFRVCPKCGVEGTVVSNSSGVNVRCRVCKNWWPVSGSRAPDKRLPLTAPRGLSKQTRVTPDVSIAFEPDEE